ncbi:MAG: hypothetical protein K8R91_04385 [Phycisphaerae bacterium]|nr:hypothetical protein [Phycisphaerae bacterium]
MRRTAFLTFVVLLMRVATTYASPYEFDGKWVDVEYWAGSGSNMALCVVDFGQDSYALGYRWDDGDTVARPAGNGFSNDPVSADISEAMLLIFSYDAVLTVNYHYHATWGFGIDGFEYDGQSIVGDGWVTTYPGYWLSDDGETWAPSGFGTSSRILSDGDWDGWSQEYVANGWSPINEPNTPLPEPATLVLLGMGGAMLLGRGRAISK